MSALTPTLWLVDVDDTLIQTDSKCPPGVEVTVAALDRHGQPLSFMTPRQRALVALMAATGDVVPVTGRTLEALARVSIPFTSWRIASHGAVIVDASGAPLESWASRVYPALEGRAAALRHQAAELEAHVRREGLSVRARLLFEHGVPTYVSVKADRESDLDAALAGWRPGPDFAVFRHGRNAALLPPEVRKAAAVAHLLAHVRATSDVLALAVGDSLGDVPFLSLCDFAMAPRGSAIGLDLERRCGPK